MTLANVIQDTLDYIQKKPQNEKNSLAFSLIFF